jgi:hypothetical protein
VREAIMAIEVGSGAAVYEARGTDTIADEAMSEVDLSSQGWAAHTVYEVADATKRYLKASAAAVFQADTAGNSVFETITPSEVEYCGGRIFLSAARGATDVVRCHSATIFPTISAIFKCIMSDFNDLTEGKETIGFGESAISRAPGIDDWNATLQALRAKKQAELTTSGGNSNSHLRLIHVPGGADGDDITLTIVDPSASSQPLSVSVSTTDIEVSLETDGAGALASTAREVTAALNADLDVAALNVRCLLPAGESGLGIVGTLTETALNGGLDLQDFASLKGETFVVIFYDDESSDVRHEGFALLEQITVNDGPKDIVKAELKLAGQHQRLNWRG